ncbi:hypothetical protein GEMRC1_012313 [Eukaryota sp. GEM-RC1]
MVFLKNFMPRFPSTTQAPNPQFPGSNPFSDNQEHHHLQEKKILQPEPKIIFAAPEILLDSSSSDTDDCIDIIPGYFPFNSTPQDLLHAKFHLMRLLDMYPELPFTDLTKELDRKLFPSPKHTITFGDIEESVKTYR